MSAVALTLYSLWWREIVRFLRQRNRVIGSLLQPLIFWLLFGFGLGASFRPQLGEGAAGVSYLEYYFPGTLALILLFTAIFSSISVIEDRNEGFLQSVLVAPVPRAAIALGKVLGGATLAVLHGLVFALLGPLVALFVPGLELPLDGVALGLLVLAMAAIAVGLSAIGFCFAWRTDSVAGFHAVMSVLLFPMWLLSGAFFPLAGVPAWLQWLMWLNPLTYGVAALRHALYRTTELGPGVPSLWLAAGVTVGFALALLAFTPVLMRPRGR